MVWALVWMQLTQPDTSAALGPSACKVWCQSIISRNRRRKNNSRIMTSSVNNPEAFLLTIVTPIGRTAQSLTVKVLAKEYRRPQVGLYIPHIALQRKKDVFSANKYCLVRFYRHTIVKANDVLDIGANIGLWSAAALRTPGVKIFAIEPVAKLTS